MLPIAGRQLCTLSSTKLFKKQTTKQNKNSCRYFLIELISPEQSLSVQRGFPSIGFCFFFWSPLLNSSLRQFLEMFSWTSIHLSTIQIESLVPFPRDCHSVITYKEWKQTENISTATKKEVNAIQNIEMQEQQQKKGALYAEKSGPSIRKLSELEKWRHLFFLGYMAFCHCLSLCVVQYCKTKERPLSLSLHNYLASTLM